jgi:nitroreductase
MKEEPVQDTTANPVLAQLAARKSVRVFSDEPVTPAEKDAILEACAQAPTAGNQQLYTVVDVTDAAEKDALSKLCDNQPFIAAAPLALVFLADTRKWPRIYAEAGVDARPAGPGDLLLAVSDATIAAQNAVVAAWSLGIGSCYIGDVMENHDGMVELLGLPAGVFPCCMVVFGHPTQKQLERPKPPRMPRAAWLVENRYRDLDGVTAREALASRVPERTGFDAWVRAFCARKYESAFAAEMNASVARYLKDVGEVRP